MSGSEKLTWSVLVYLFVALFTCSVLAPLVFQIVEWYG